MNRYRDFLQRNTRIDDMDVAADAAAEVLPADGRQKDTASAADRFRGGRERTWVE